MLVITAKQLKLRRIYCDICKHWNKSLLRINVNLTHLDICAVCLSKALNFIVVHQAEENEG